MVRMQARILAVHKPLVPAAESPTRAPLTEPVNSVDRLLAGQERVAPSTAISASLASSQIRTSRDG
jgi:hypothetical protein